MPHYIFSNVVFSRNLFISSVCWMYIRVPSRSEIQVVGIWSALFSKNMGNFCCLLYQFVLFQSPNWNSNSEGTLLYVVVNTYYISKCIQLWEGSREGQWTCLESEKIFCKDTLLFFMFLQFYFIHFSKQSLPLVVPINLAQLSTKKHFKCPFFSSISIIDSALGALCFFGSNRIKCESRYCTVWHQLGPILHLDSTMTCRNYVCWMKVCTL